MLLRHVKVFNVWLSSHIWLFWLVSSQLIAARCLDQRQRVSFRPGPVFNTAACVVQREVVTLPELKMKFSETENGKTTGE
ncbi:hypothetical protein EYF80_040973 [Liparis tanakae]|uniref:Secreted protein n=1 Tax=Liparis tanakae TaxID=230148 RepID=A0A4Z2G5G1_9TELE|nr:hypothetical protein EYF80_040973 [Liparis tanakae]